METIEEYNKFRIVRDNDGLLGLIFNSEVIEHCEYNEITRMDDYFLCRKAGMEKQIDFNGKTCMTATMNPDPAENKGADGYIIVCSKNQKYGLLSPDRKEILPAVYDELHKWYDCDVIYTRSGNRCEYFNTAGNKILTNVRNIPEAEDKLEPYYDGDPQTNVVQLMDMSSNCVGEDYCDCHGVRAGLSRRLHSEHAAYIQSLANIIPFEQNAIDSFMAWDCYIFSAFAVDSENGVIDCIKQLEKIQCFDPSWQWNYVVLFPSKPSYEQIDEIRWIFKCLEQDIWSHFIPNVAFGVDEDVKGVKIIGTRYFCDHWPSDEEFEDASRGTNESLKELKQFFESCTNNRQNKLDDALTNVIHENYDTTDLGKDWSLKYEKLELLLSLGATLSRNAVIDLIDRIKFSIEHTKDSAFKTLTWLIEKGANVNAVSNGQSSLDLLDEYVQQRNWEVKDAETFKNMLLAHGAKHAKEIREEECRLRGISEAFFFKS